MIKEQNASLNFLRLIDVFIYLSLLYIDNYYLLMYVFYLIIFIFHLLRWYPAWMAWLPRHAPVLKPLEATAARDGGATQTDAA